jgi:hypothetical protein
VIGCCADFWQTKDPEAWTEKDLASIRSKSPWARREAQIQSTRTKQTVLKTVSAGTTTIKTTTPEGKTQAQTIQKTRTVPRTQTVTVRQGVADVQIRWESAAPLLAATARIDPALRKVFDKLTGEYYLVSLTGLALSEGYDFSAAINDLLAGSSLHLGSKVVRPSRVSEMSAGDGPLYLLQFSRDGSLEDYDKSIEIQVSVGGSQTRASFEPKQMVFHGRRAL